MAFNAALGLTVLVMPVRLVGTFSPSRVKVIFRFLKSHDMTPSVSNHVIPRMRSTPPIGNTSRSILKGFFWMTTSTPLHSCEQESLDPLSTSTGKGLSGTKGICVARAVSRHWDPLPYPFILILEIFSQGFRARLQAGRCRAPLLRSHILMASSLLFVDHQKIHWESLVIPSTSMSGSWLSSEWGAIPTHLFQCWTICLWGLVGALAPFLFYT